MCSVCRDLGASKLAYVETSKCFISMKRDQISNLQEPSDRARFEDLESDLENRCGSQTDVVFCFLLKTCAIEASGAAEFQSDGEKNVILKEVWESEGRFRIAAPAPVFLCCSNAPGGPPGAHSGRTRLTQAAMKN